MVNYIPTTNRLAEAILVHDLEQTYDPTSKAKTEPYTLDLEPVPPLPEGTKPFRDDGDSSTRASSSAPPDTTPAPVKRARKEPASKVRETSAFTSSSRTPDVTSACTLFIQSLLPTANKTPSLLLSTPHRCQRRTRTILKPSDSACSPKSTPIP
jgi:hypothetical protein